MGVGVKDQAQAAQKDITELKVHKQMPQEEKQGDLGATNKAGRGGDQEVEGERHVQVQV